MVRKNENTLLIALKKGEIQTHKLQQEIKADSGLLFALIHPFYHEYLQTRPDLDDVRRGELMSRFGQRNSRRKKVEEQFSSISIEGYLERLYNLLRGNNSPILLAEEGRSIDNSIHRIRQFGHTGKIMYYRTQEDSPSPSGLFTWQEMVKRFYLIGVKRLFVGGQLSRLEGKGEDKYLYGCVPSFIDSVKQAARYENVSIELFQSPVSFPYFSGDKN